MELSKYLDLCRPWKTSAFICVLILLIMIISIPGSYTSGKKLRAGGSYSHNVRNGNMEALQGAIEAERNGSVYSLFLLVGTTIPFSMLLILYILMFTPASTENLIKLLIKVSISLSIMGVIAYSVAIQINRSFFAFSGVRPDYPNSLFAALLTYVIFYIFIATVVFLVKTLGFMSFSFLKQKLYV